MAVPVFARKYQTSCSTCHTVFPKLNPFGEAFRLNGYRMPEEVEDQVKQKPVSLGAEAYKSLWPSAVWPNELPGNAPLAVNLKMADVYASNVQGFNTKTIVHNDTQFPQEVNLFAAGTLGDHASFFVELTNSETPGGDSATEIEHARLDFDSIAGPDHLVNLRVGKFAPNLYDGFQEMWIMTDNGIDTMFTYNPVGFNGGTGLDDGQGIVSLPARVRGLELYGVAAHRLFYTVGIGNKIGPGALDSTGTPTGNFNNNTHKDIYARIDYKFGGMGLDGYSKGVDLPPENWRESSFRIGLFGLSGNGRDIDFAVTDPVTGNPYHMQDINYTRVGMFASWMLGDLNVMSGAVHGSDMLQLRDAGNISVLNETPHTYDSWFTQADYVIEPPFQVSARYEHLRVADPTVKPIRALNLNFTYLVAANLKSMLEYRRDLNESQNYQLALVVRVAF